MSKKEVKNREYLRKAIYQYSFIGNDGAVEEDSEENEISMYQVHNGFYVVAPDVIRRNFFLSSNEKEVLWELFSWAANDGGFCSVSQRIMCTNLNLSESTVKKVINSLQKKQFIEKRKTTKRRNVYKIVDLRRNPYILLSEYCHKFLQRVIKYATMDESFIFNEEEYNTPLTVDGYLAGVLYFVNTESIYMPFINKLMTKEVNFKEVYNITMADVGTAINKCYNLKVSEILKRNNNKYGNEQIDD